MHELYIVKWQAETGACRRKNIRLSETANSTNSHERTSELSRCKQSKNGVRTVSASVHAALKGRWDIRDACPGAGRTWRRSLPWLPTIALSGGKGGEGNSGRCGRCTFTLHEFDKMDANNITTDYNSYTVTYTNTASCRSFVSLFTYDQNGKKRT